MAKSMSGHTSDGTNKRRKVSPSARSRDEGEKGDAADRSEEHDDEGLLLRKNSSAQDERVLDNEGNGGEYEGERAGEGNDGEKKVSGDRYGFEDEDEDDEEGNDGDGDTHEGQPMTLGAAILQSDGRYRNKQRCLVLCSRGVTARYRHLLEDLRALIPHHKKESKLDAGDAGMGRAVSDIAEMKGCNTYLLLECRKRQDAYMWIGRAGSGAGVAGASGPSAKFHVSNVHTMDELRLTGNCMKGSRPILSFDESFGRLGHLKLLKELFVDVFGTPRGHPKSKPFVDRVMAFYYADKRIWVRNYQILEQQPSNALEAHRAKKLSGQTSATSLVEIGPRFVLDPIRIFRGSFGGQTLFQNPNFVSPNEIRAMAYREKGQSYDVRKQAERNRKDRKEQLILPEDPLDSVFRE